MTRAQITEHASRDARFPGAAISVLVRKGNESIYEGHPFLKEALVWNKKENKLRVVGIFKDM